MSIQQCLFLLPTSGGESYWTTQINLPANTDATNSSNEVKDFAVDSGGNIYVAGCRDDNSGPMNGYILKLHKNGTLEASTEDGGGSIDFTPRGIAVDSNDDVYTYIGYGRMSKYNSYLNSLYYARESKWGGGQNFGEGLNGNGCLFVNANTLTTYGNQGSGIVCGFTFDTSTGDVSNGGYNYIQPSILMYYGANKLPGSSSVYLSGTSDNGNGTRYWTTAFLGNGLSQSFKFYGGSNNASAHAVTQDSSGKMYVAGHMNNVPTITKIDSYNNSLTNQGTAWWRKMNTSGRYNDLTADNFGNVYGAIGGAIVKYNSSGTLLWAKSFSGGTVRKIEIIDSILYAISTLGPTSIMVGKLPITGQGLSNANWTDSTFNYINQDGTSGFTTQSDLNSTAPAGAVWGGLVSSNFSTNVSYPTFSQGSITNISVPYGDVEFTTPGTYSWTVPNNVTQVSVLCIGGGGAGNGQGGAGGGGGLGWRNGIAVTPGQSYTVVVGDKGAPTGEQEWTTPGTYSWTCPAGVTSVSAVCIGAGGGNNNQQWSGGGGGGALAWKNNIPVTPGQTYTVEVGDQWPRASGYYPGETSYFINLTTCAAEGGWPDNDIWTPANAPGGTVLAGDGGGSGGRGGMFDSSATSQSPHITTAYGGGGGAGGYSGNGGDGGCNDLYGSVQRSAGQGGGGGGGFAQQDSSLTSPSGFTNGAFDTTHGGGGGVGIYGEGASGAAGTNYQQDRGGQGGSGGTQGLTTLSYQGNSTPGTYGPGSGGLYGGGSGGGGDAGHGAVRLIWGAGRAFPSTNTQNQPSGGSNGEDSYFINTSNVKGGGGGGTVTQSGGSGGSYTGDGGGNGGNGGSTAGGGLYEGGGGGAGGYSGNGGNGGGGDGTSNPQNAGVGGAGGDGSGGGGGGGAYGGDYVGGGTEPHGEGASGLGCGLNNAVSCNGSGQPGSVVGDHAYGGGGSGNGVAGNNGIVRIIWGPGRGFPSTNTNSFN